MINRAYLIAVTIITAASATWFYESRETGRQGNSLAAERNRALDLQRQLAELQQQRDDALRAAADAEHDLPSRQPEADTVTATDLSRSAQTKAWLAKVKRIKQSFADLPAQAIPELKLLTDVAWLSLARTASTDSELGLRKARSAARTLAIQRFTPLLGAALRGYTEANGGNLPTDIVQLTPYFNGPVDPDMLQRYVITGSGNIQTTKGRVLGGRTEVIGERTPVDEDFDSYHLVNANGGNASFDSWAESRYQRVGFQAMSEFSAANNGRSAKTAADLLPYIHDPMARPVAEAMVQFEKEHQKRFSSYEELRPYVTNPVQREFLERLIIAAQKNRSR